MTPILTRAWNAAFHPTTRLNPDFPLTGKRLGKAYGVGLLWVIAGCFSPLVLLFAYMLGAMVARQFGYVRVGEAMIKLLTDDAGGNIKQSVLTGLVVSSFVLGFGLQMRYFSRVLARTGHKLLTSLGLGIGPLRHNSWPSTLWAIGWRVLVAVAIVQLGEILLGILVAVPEKPTLTFAKSLAEGNVWTFFAMAAVLVPLFEEVIFRGLLFQAVRGTFYQWRQAALSPDAAPRSLIAGVTTRLGATVFATETRVDVGAIVLSAAMFAVQHNQFEPMILLVLFAMGVVLAEIFRRTGTLWAGIAVHAICNGVATLILIYQS